jgi:hypothetical protein
MSNQSHGTPPSHITSGGLASSSPQPPRPPYICSDKKTRRIERYLDAGMKPAAIVGKFSDIPTQEENEKIKRVRKSTKWRSKGSSRSKTN